VLLVPYAILMHILSLKQMRRDAPTTRQHGVEAKAILGSRPVTALAFQRLS
jgi:hypothetical protein